MCPTHQIQCYCLYSQYCYLAINILEYGFNLHLILASFLMYLANPLLEASKQAFKSIVDIMKIHCLPTVTAKKKKKIVCHICLLSSELRRVRIDPITYLSAQVPSHVCQEGFAPYGSPPCQRGAGRHGPRLSSRVAKSQVLSGGLATRRHFTLTWGLLSVKPFYCFCPKLSVSFESLPCLASRGQLCMEGAVLCPFKLITD